MQLWIMILNSEHWADIIFNNIYLISHEFFFFVVYKDKTAEPIRPKFLMATNINPGKV